MSNDSGAQPSGAGSRKIPGVFALAMINVTAVLSIRNFPSLAEYGRGPASGGTLPGQSSSSSQSRCGCRARDRVAGRRGGIYAWVKQA